MTDTAKPTVDAVVDAALTRTLTLLARVSRRQGWMYDGPALFDRPGAVPAQGQRPYLGQDLSAGTTGQPALGMTLRTTPVAGTRAR